MVINIVRLTRSAKSVFGYLFCNGQFLCYTLENSIKIIPAGEYEYELYNSPKNKRRVPLLKNVPGRSMIEIHIANEPDELEGCIAVGITKTDSFLLDSASAFNKLMLINANSNGIVRIIQS